MMGTMPAWLTFRGDVGALALGHAAADDALGELHRDAALAQLDPHHRDEHADRDGHQHGEHDELLALKDGVVAVRETRDDGGEDQDGHPVGDTALADELTDPHEERSAGHQRGDDEECTRHERIEQHDIGCLRRGAEERRTVALAEDEGEARTLEERDDDRDVARGLRDLALAHGAHLLPLLQLRDDDVQDLHDDAGRDVGHDAEREDRERPERTAREQVEEPERTLGVGGLLQLGDGGGIDTGNAQGGPEAVHRDHEDGEHHLAAEILHPEDVHQAREQSLPLA